MHVSDGYPDWLHDSVPEVTETPGERVMFFYEHAPVSWDARIETKERGRQRGALDLALAEAHAKERGWVVRTSTDPVGPMGDDANSVELVASGAYVCLMVELYGAETEAGERKLLLGSICDVVVPSNEDPYIRVLGAQLAAEAIAERDTARRDTANRIKEALGTDSTCWRPGPASDGSTHGGPHADFDVSEDGTEVVVADSCLPADLAVEIAAACRAWVERQDAQ